MEEALLQVRNLIKSFGGVRAVSNVSFDLRKGEVLGVIGPNGSGKTTLLNLITGFVPKDHGNVVFNNKEITKTPAHKISNLGLVRTFQIVRPYVSMPTFKNLIPPLFSPRVKRSARGQTGRQRCCRN